MNLKSFWSDALRSGAILGGVMALSAIFENYLLVSADLSLGSLSSFYALEALVAVALYIYLLVRFTRCAAVLAEQEVGFNFGQAFSYVLAVSMLAGVIVGLAKTLYVAAIGYDVYVGGLLSRLEQLHTLYLDMGFRSDDLKMINELAQGVRTMEQPSIWSNIFSSLYNYMLLSGVPGLIIAGVVSRRKITKE